MSIRDQITATARRLTIEQGKLPSLEKVAAAAGVSKGGLLHHFPSRDDLVIELARAAIHETDEALAVAAREGHAAQTWLRLAILDDDDARLFLALGASFRDLGPSASVILEEADQATKRWERLIAEQVGDETLAKVIRLVGDGLTFSALTASEDQSTLERLNAYLVGKATGSTP